MVVAIMNLGEDVSGVAPPRRRTRLPIRGLSDTSSFVMLVVWMNRP